MPGAPTAAPPPVPKSGASAPRPASPPTPDRPRFTLAGPSRPLDHRVEAARRDLADIAVAGRWFAPHYAERETRRIARATEVRVAADGNADVLGRLAPGDRFDTLEVSGGWAWGYGPLVGYVPIDSLA